MAIDREMLKRILRHNGDIDDDQRSIAQVHRDHYEAELEIWRRKAEAARLLLELLEAKVEETEASVALWSSIDAPIRVLPPEVLSRVFALACAADAVDLFSTKPRKGDEPTSHLLTRVCRHWRDVALKDPNVWGHFVALAPHGMDASRIQRLQPRWEAMLNLYGKNLSHLELSSFRWTEDEIPILRRVLRHPDRITSLRTIVPAQFSDGFKEWSQPLLMARLEELLVVIASQMSEDRKNGLVPAHMPALKRLSLQVGSCAYQSYTMLDLPYHQLTHLTLTKPRLNMSPMVTSKSTLRNILRQLDQLVYLHLGHMRLDRDVIRSDQPPPSDTELELKEVIVLPSLKTFEIHDPRWDMIDARSAQNTSYDYDSYASLKQPTGILSLMVAPSLESFDFISEIHHEDPQTFNKTCASISSFLSRSPNLRQIRAVLTVPGWTNPDPDTSSLPFSYGALTFAGNRKFFTHTLGITSHPDDRLFLAHGVLQNTPFNKMWPSEVGTMERFIDRVLEEKDPYFDKAALDAEVEWCRDLAGIDIYSSQHERYAMVSICDTVLGSRDIVEGSRKVYFIL